MASFADLVPLTDTVTVRDRVFPVKGLELVDLGQLFSRFPELEAQFKAGKITPVDLLQMSAATVAGIIAAATGKAGDPAEEKGIAALALAEKAAFIERIFALTAPGGLGPFVDLVLLAVRLLRGTGESDPTAKNLASSASLALPPSA